MTSILMESIVLFEKLNAEQKGKYYKIFAVDENDRFCNLIYKDDNEEIIFTGKSEFDLDIKESFYLEKLKVDILKKILKGDDVDNGTF